ncbi:MAG: AMP-binding protein [Thermodesulfobacteriota bacterium]
MDGFVPWPAEFVRKYIEKGYWAGLPLGDHLDRWVVEHADRPAILWEGREISFRQMGINVDRLAYHLSQIGLQTYDRVIVQMLNTPELIYLVYACYKLGAIPICSLPLHRWTEISFFADKTKARAHVIPGEKVMGFDFGDFADKVQDEYPNVEIIITADAAFRPNMVGIKELIARDVDEAEIRAELAKHKPDPMKPAIFQLSGGTTGVPKIVPRTHNDYAYNARCNAEAQGIRAGDRLLGSVPMMHNAGLICGVMPTHLTGAAFAPCAPKTQAILECIDRNQTNIIAMVPVFLHELLAVPGEELARYDLACVETLAWGGNPVAQEIQMKFRETFHCKSIQVYGMAEGLICWTRPDDPLDVQINTQGRPVSEADEVIAADVNTGLEVPVGGIGECWTRGPYTIRGYFDAEEHNAVVFTEDGYYKTGDLIRKDAYGNITFAGRIKDCISRGAEKVNAEEVEAHIVEFPKVDQAAVVGMPDEVYGERVCAFVVPLPDQKFALEELNEFLLNVRQVARFKTPERLEFIDELPISAVGKLEKKTLRKKIMEIIRAEGGYTGESDGGAPRVKTARQAFDAMRRVFSPEAAQGVTEVFQFHITGAETPDWFISIKDRACLVGEGNNADPTVTLTMTETDFLELRNGEVDGRTLLMGGRIKADGNIMAAALMLSLFPVK